MCDVTTANARCEAWISLGENHEGKFLYEENSILKIKGRVFAVDMMVIVSAAYSEWLAVEMPLKGVSAMRFHDVIDCRSRFYECMRIRYYDINRKLLADTQTSESSDQPPGLRAIPADTPIERLADIVCK